MVRKMNVSETVMCELSRGIFVVRRELATTVIMAKIANFTSSRPGVRRHAARAIMAAPHAMIAHIYFFRELNSVTA
jgi:hypothetical protein